MIEYGGYIFRIDENQRAGLMSDYIQRDKSFTDTISATDWQTKQTEIFLISLKADSIHYAALGRKGKRVATQKYQMRFLNFVEFSPPIILSDIQNSLRPQIQQYFIRSSSGLGARVPPATWQDLVNAIKKLRPTSTDDLDKLERLRKLAPDLFNRTGFQIVAEERDAINLSLRMAGFEHTDFLDWDIPAGDKLAPFLQGLQSVTSREDHMIIHDAQFFGDWKLIDTHRVGTAVFQHDNERLTVLNVNRHRIEETLGVDLLYYFHQYNSYVFVQYKRMEKEGDTFKYRPNDKSYKAELIKMQKFSEQFRLNNPIANLNDYRLNAGAFFFKLCPTEVFEPTSKEMIHGMYLPLDYWNVLLESPQIRGKKDGLAITYNNAGRYFNNTLFVDLAKSGWIGSRVTEMEVITRIIKDALEGNRSMLLAAKLPSSS
jgi:hypothetical protein